MAVLTLVNSLLKNKQKKDCLYSESIFVSYFSNFLNSNIIIINYNKDYYSYLFVYLFILLFLLLLLLLYGSNTRASERIWKQHTGTVERFYVELTVSKLE